MATRPPSRQAKSNRYAVPTPSNGTAKTSASASASKSIVDASVPLIRGIEPELQDICEKYALNPLGFVEDMFFWDSDGFLRGKTGPLQWQTEVLEDVTMGLNEHPDIIRLAVSSGKGVGKTALLAQLFIWHVATHPHSQTTMTAVVGRQIQDRPWREVRKWLWKSKLYPFFMTQSTKLVHRSIDTWYGTHQTWSEERPEAFQGSHEQHVCFLVDEASGVPDSILETIETGLTDSHVFLAYFSNPTRPTGRFRECFEGGRNVALWESYQIDARDVEITNKERIQEQLDEAQGDVESTSFRVNVRGLFALEGHDQFIPEAVIRLAQDRDDVAMDDDPLVIGADIARMGSNKTVFMVRKGCRILEKRVYGKQELDVTADRLIELMEKYKAQDPITFIDTVGYGAGVHDICKRARYKVEEVNSALPANDSMRYANKRVEMWADTREWLRVFGCLDPSDKMLASQLMEPTYHIDIQGRFMLESKEQMQNRGYASPDEADALVYTFARRIGRSKEGILGPPKTYYHPLRGLFGR